MLKLALSAVLLILSLMILPARGWAQAVEEGKSPPPVPPRVAWQDLLAGKLTDHWTDMNCSLADSFKLGKDEQGVAVLAGSGHPIGLVRSMRAYENFILEVEWRHLTEAPSAAKSGPGGTTGNSGIYVWADPVPALGNSFTRAIEVQVCNLGNGAWYTSNGDLFPIHGATMIPDPRFGVSGSRSMPTEFRGSKTGQWNRCRVTCVDGTIQEELNGAVVTAGFRCSPRKGYLCLESEGGPVEFKNMRLTELPPNRDLKPEQVSITLASNVRTTTLFNGLTLKGWTGAELEKAGWSMADRILKCSAEAKESLRHDLPGADFTLIIDWQTAKKGGKENALPFDVTGLVIPANGESIHQGWNRAEIQFGAADDGLKVNGRPIQIKRGEGDARALLLHAPGHAVEFCNVIRMDRAIVR
ncbi:MAG TPA: family 16 glycoside hydrolase [Tepidisphaeraceae bacterium]|jgi:hypothetical protein